MNFWETLTFGFVMLGAFCLMLGVFLSTWAYNGGNNVPIGVYAGTSFFNDGMCLFFVFLVAGLLINLITGKNFHKTYP